MNTRVEDMSMMTSEEIEKKEVLIDGQRILFDTRVLLVPSSVEYN